MSVLTSKDIVDIIRACNKSRVSSLEFGELKIKFDEPAEIASSPKKSSWKSKATDDQETPTQNPEQLELEELEKMIEEINVAQLSLTDPTAFESLQLEGDDNDEA